MTWESQNQSQHINQLRLILNFIFGQLPLVKIKQFKLKFKKKLSKHRYRFKIFFNVVSLKLQSKSNTQISRLVVNFLLLLLGFMNRVSFSYHIRTHNEADRRFACEECLKPFITRAKLRQHMRCHTGEKTFKERERNPLYRIVQKHENPCKNLYFCVEFCSTGNHL